MAGRLNQQELLKLFPVISRPGIAHGRSRHKKRKTATLHGRSRGSHLAAQAKRDPFKHKAEAKHQG